MANRSGKADPEEEHYTRIGGLKGVLAPNGTNSLFKH